MNRITIFAIALLRVCPSFAQKKALFNGNNLDGWTVYGTEKWYVEDGY